MKKYFISVFAIAMALVACKKEVAPVVEQEEDTIVEYTVPVHVTIDGSDTKAHYESDLKFNWDEGDQIIALKGWAATPFAGNTNYHRSTTDDHTLTLSNIKTNTADFEGNITVVGTEAAYWHFLLGNGAYIETSATTESIGIFNYKYTRSVVARVTIPTTQFGTYIPYGYACTETAVSEINSMSLRFQPLSACYAIRLFEENGTTPKQAKSIKLISNNGPIAGTLEGTSTVEGINVVATPITQFGSVGEENSITVDTQNIEQTSGIYEYLITVPAGDLGGLVLEVYDNDNNKIVRSIPAINVLGGHKQAFKVKWDSSSDDTNVAFSSFVNPKTSYDYYLAENIETANSVDAKSAVNGVFEMNATCSRDVKLTKYGVYYLVGKDIDVNNLAEATYVPIYEDASGIVNPSAPVSASFSVTLPSLGNNSVQYVAYAVANNKEFMSEVQTYTAVVTGLPYRNDFANNNYDNWYSSKTNKGFESNTTGAKIAHGGTIYSPAFNIPNNINVAISGYAYFDRNLKAQFRVVNCSFFYNETANGNFNFPASGSCSASFSTTNNYLELSYSGGFSTSFILKNILIEYGIN